ncbi:Kelch repeat-containing protein [Piscinibacterium candidicorallinum]|uniref:Kelch repeat-containing protein n=1 Tax=Piscinibacterium candidicorallinum TaxID=1793872 RepID=A0ABV7H485_9BURK
MTDRRQVLHTLAALPLAVSLSARAASPAGPVWRAAPSLPLDVQEIYPALHGGEIWVAGGFTHAGGKLGATERVVAFDLDKQQWREAPALPTPSHHVHLASVNGSLLAVGGFIGGESRTQWIATPRVLRLDGARWVEQAPLPRPIGEAVPLVLDGRLHLIGGRAPTGSANAGWRDHVDVDEHLVLEDGRWRRAAPLPLARNSHGGAVLAGELHIISGRTVAGNNAPQSAHHIYDPKADRWREGAPFPEPRGGIAAAVWRGQLVAAGGELFDPPSVGSTVYIWGDGRWTRLSSLPTARHGHGLIAAGDALYALGGAAQAGARGTLASMDLLS